MWTCLIQYIGKDRNLGIKNDACVARTTFTFRVGVQVDSGHFLDSTGVRSPGICGLFVGTGRAWCTTRQLLVEVLLRLVRRGYGAEAVRQGKRHGEAGLV